MEDYTDLVMLARTDVHRLVEIADARAERIRVLESEICGTSRMTVFLAHRWGLTKQESTLLTLALTLRRPSYETLQDFMNINKQHLASVLCHMRRKLPPKAIATAWGVGVVIETAMRVQLLEGFEQ